MDVNNMKVTDLKKELKSRGLSIVGNKSELMSRLAAALETNGEPLEANNGGHNEDSVLEDQLLGDESVADESLNKSDDHLIDDLLDTNETKDDSETVKKDLTPKKKIITKSPIKLSTKPLITKPNLVNQTTTPSSPTKPVSDSTEKLNTDSTVTELKKTDTIKVLTAEERKQLRAQKFGDNKLSERANRFGLKSEESSNNTKPKIEESLQKRAQRFGAISDKVKQLDDNQKLLKRKERFGFKSESDIKSTTTTTTTATDESTPGKRKITFSGNDGDRKQQRLARFGKFL